MDREKINWKVEEKDIKEFIELINIEIPIDKGQYGYIFNERKIKNMLPKDYFKNLEKSIVDILFNKDVYKKYKTILESKLSLSYIPNFKDGNWMIGYSPVEIYNNIFETLNINQKIDYINYSDKEIVSRTKKNIDLTLTIEKLGILRDKSKKDKLLFIEDAVNAIDKVFMFNGYDMESRMQDCVIYKNLLYYLSVKSLDILDDTDDIKYAIIPKTYYKEVTTIGKAEWPNQLFMGDAVYSYNFNNFNDRFNKVLIRYPILLENELGIEEIGVMNQIDIVKADNFIDDVTLVYNKYVEKTKCKKTYTKDDFELNKMLIDKIEFYKDLLNKVDEDGNKVVVSPIKGKNNLYGYYGFILNNNYIVLDKFFNVRLTDNKIKPAKDEAIYVLPLDLFNELHGSKRLMMKYIKENPTGNVKRYYHTKKHSYKERIFNIAKKEDVSVLKSNWFLPLYTKSEESKLVLKKD